MIPGSVWAGWRYHDEVRVSPVRSPRANDPWFDLAAGGSQSTNPADVVDTNATQPTVKPTKAMAYGRRQHDLTALADGSVLATGGNSSGASLVDLNAGVHHPEVWDPGTGKWRTLA